MSDELKKKLLKYGITAGLGALMAFITMNNYGIFAATEWKAISKILADAFTIPGMLFILIGCLVWVSGDGFFDGISYALSYTFKLLVPGAEKKMPKYADYVELKRDKREKNKFSFAFLFIVGGIYLLIAIIFIILYYAA